MKINLILGIMLLPICSHSEIRPLAGKTASFLDSGATPSITSMTLTGTAGPYDLTLSTSIFLKGGCITWNDATQTCTNPALSGASLTSTNTWSATQTHTATVTIATDGGIVFNVPRTTSTTTTGTFTVTRLAPGVVDATFSTLTLTGFLPPERARVCIACNWSGGTANEQLFVGFLRDSALWEGITSTTGLMQKEVAGAGTEAPIHRCALSPSLTAGSHNFAVIWWTASNTLSINPGSYQVCEFSVERVWQ